ncbi:MAG: OmpA family protein [Candidatus Eisenbacteria bacterium]|nr:OmpA family protein [Candidatus Eisenbacteria bacterium]
MNRHLSLAAMALIVATVLNGCSRKSDGPMAETTGSTPSPTGSQIISPSPTSWDRSVMPTPQPSVRPLYRVNEITFAPGTTQSGPEGQGVCREVATNLLGRNVKKVLLIGFTDMSETDGGLPMKRAESIRSCLVAHGMTAGQVELASYGSSMARGDKQQPAQMEQDRRVEIWVLSE